MSSEPCHSRSCWPKAEARAILGRVSELDCLTCGACCFSQLANYVSVTGDDYERLERANLAEAFVSFDGHKAFLRMEDGHCKALRVDQSAPGAPRFFCEAYDSRPSICRSLERGQHACAGERASKLERISRRPLVQASALLKAHRQ